MWKRCTGFVLLSVLSTMIQGSPAYGVWNPLQDPAIIGWWTCDEGEGVVVADSSFNGNDGIFVKGSPGWTTGFYGNAVRLVGPTLVQIPAVDLTLTEATMAGWFLPYGVQPEWASIIMHRNPGPAHGFNLLPDRRLAYHWNDTYESWTFRGNAYHAADEWTFCALTVEPTKATFYVNGVEASVNRVIHTAATWDGLIWLGGDGNSSWVSRRMNGALDDVSFFGRALTGAEIRAIMLGLGAEGPIAAGGLFTEGFETNDFSKYPWEYGGDAPWVTSRQERHLGAWSAQAGSIADNETSVLQVAMECASGRISFYRKISSEPDFDVLTFLIDGEERASWSGEEDWAAETFPVAEGRRVFEWVYAKDRSTSEGSDTAWIDDIVFPPLPVPEADGFNLYLDGVGPNIIASGPPNAGLLDYHSRDNPASGDFCIHWTGVDQYGPISFVFSPIKDLSAEVQEGFVVDLWVRCSSRNAQFDLRFMDTKTNKPGDHPWRMRYPVDGAIARWNGEWNHLQIPLRQFSEHGSWDNDRWYGAIGAFDWTAVERFDIVAEYYDLRGIHFYFDDIRVIDPGSPR